MKSRKKKTYESFLEWRAGTRKEGRKVLTEGWRKGVPINNTPRRGATVATPITPIVTHVSLYIRIRTYVCTHDSDSPFGLLRPRGRKLRTDLFPFISLFSFSFFSLFN